MRIQSNQFNSIISFFDGVARDQFTLQAGNCVLSITGDLNRAAIILQMIGIEFPMIVKRCGQRLLVIDTDVMLNRKWLSIWSAKIPDTEYAELVPTLRMQ